MNPLTRSLIPALCVVTFAWLSSAGEDPHEPDYQLQPLITHYARTATKYTLQMGVRYFDDIELQEADHFDGYTVDAELTVPFLKRFQLRLLYPAYTDGEARVTDAGNPAKGETVDVDGRGGVFDFASAFVDYQWMKAEDPTGWNLAAYGGTGTVLDPLDTSIDDLYNHRGRVGLFGLKADKTFSERLTGLANLGARYYWESDDLHPKNDDEDVFWFMDASAAVVYNPFDRWLYPVLELVYQGDLGSYNSLELAPEVIVPFCEHFEMKAGAGFALTSDGERWQARLQAVVRY